MAAMMASDGNSSENVTTTTDEESEDYQENIVRIINCSALLIQYLATEISL